MGSGIDLKCRTCGHEWSVQSDNNIDPSGQDAGTCPNCGEKDEIEKMFFLWD